MRTFRFCAGVSLALLAVSAAGAHAGGLYLPGSGTQSQARAGAFVARADDPSALAENPAGFAKGEGTVIQIAANLIDMSLEFTREGRYESLVVDDGNANHYPTVRDQSEPEVGLGKYQAIPILAMTTDLGLDLPGVRFGLGLFAPNSYAQRDFGDYDFEDPTRNPPPNRYDVQKQEVAAAFPSVGASYSLTSDRLGGAGELDLGARVSWGIASIKATNYLWAIRNYEEEIGNDGLFELDAKDNFVPAFGLGALYRPIPTVEIGVAYSSQATIDAKGESSATLGSRLPALGGQREELIPVPDDQVTCATGGAIGALKSCLTLVLPQTASIGGRYRFLDGSGKERGDVELDVKWEDWSATSNYHIRVDGQSSLLGVRIQETIIPHGLHDVWSVRLGGSYSFPFGPGSLIVRGGAAYDTATAPEKWTRLDLDSAPRTTLTGGLAWEGGAYRIEAAAGYIFEPDRSPAACNPDTLNPECEAFAPNTFSPSPPQPLQGPRNQIISPFNGGDYSSSYRLVSLGVTTWF